MQDFKITLDNKEYDVKSHCSDSKGNNWTVHFSHGDVSATITIPIGARVTRAKAILFIEAFHEGLKAAFQNQGIDQNYIWNQSNSIR